jgi:hypothetical protein
MINQRRPQVRSEIDEHNQESFSDESVNVHCVASWSVDASQRLEVDFHNSWFFDSDRFKNRPDQVAAAILELKRIS